MVGRPGVDQHGRRRWFRRRGTRQRCLQRGRFCCWFDGCSRRECSERRHELVLVHRYVADEPHDVPAEQQPLFDVKIERVIF